MHPTSRIVWWALCVVAALLMAGESQARPTEEKTVTPKAKVQTLPVPHGGDAADDPAIWIHPTKPRKSLILATNKKGGLHVYNMDGSHRQLVSDGTEPNNVDVLYGFKLGNKLVDIALAGVRAKNSPGGKVWVIDPTTRTLSDVTEGGVFKVFGGGEPYGTTDGITVTNRPTSKKFPKGVFVAQDGQNSADNQNFKLYAWEDIAGTRLIVDTSWPPREK